MIIAMIKIKHRRHSGDQADIPLRQRRGLAALPQMNRSPPWSSLVALWPPRAARPERDASGVAGSPSSNDKAGCRPGIAFSPAEIRIKSRLRRIERIIDPGRRQKPISAGVYIIPLLLLIERIALPCQISILHIVIAKYHRRHLHLRQQCNQNIHILDQVLSFSLSWSTHQKHIEYRSYRPAERNVKLCFSQ